MSQQINLFNPQFLEKRRYFSSVTMVQALGLLFLGIFAFYGFALWRDRDLARQAAELSRAYQAQKLQVVRASAELNPEKIEAQLKPLAGGEPVSVKLDAIESVLAARR